MDFASLKNIEIKDLFAKLKSSEGIFSDKKFVVKIGLGILSVLIFLIFYYFLINPIISDQKILIDEMLQKKADIEKMENNEVNIKNKIDELEPLYTKNSKLFHSSKEFEDLYQNIGNIAMMNGLEIFSIKKNEKTPVFNDQDQTQQDNNLSQPIYYKIPVTWTIKGTYLGYLKFRKLISKTNKIINFDKEIIKVDENDKGTIISEATISIVGLPNEYEN